MPTTCKIKYLRFFNFKHDTRGLLLPKITYENIKTAPRFKTKSLSRLKIAYVV